MKKGTDKNKELTKKNTPTKKTNKRRTIPNRVAQKKR